MATPHRLRHHAVLSESSRGVHPGRLLSDPGQDRPHREHGTHSTAHVLLNLTHIYGSASIGAEGSRADDRVLDEE